VVAESGTVVQWSEGDIQSRHMEGSAQRCRGVIDIRAPLLSKAPAFEISNCDTTQDLRFLPITLLQYLQVAEHFGLRREVFSGGSISNFVFLLRRRYNKVK